MEAHDEHIQAFDLDIDVQLPQGRYVSEKKHIYIFFCRRHHFRLKLLPTIFFVLFVFFTTNLVLIFLAIPFLNFRTASAKPISVNTHNKRNNTRITPAPPHRRKAMNSDGGSIMGRAAFVALDTRVILGAILGWSLVSTVLKRWNNKNEDARSLVGEMETTTAEVSSSRTPHASILETEVKSLRKSLQELRVDNLVLAAQVAALHGGIVSSRSQRSAAPSGGKALNDAFEAAATSAIRAATRTEPYPQPSTSLPAAVLVENNNKDNQISEQRKRDEMVLLQQENEELRLALEQLRLENEEMAERMLEVAFTGAGISPATINESVNEMNDLNQLGELRNALITEAGGILEEDTLWLERASSDKEPEELLLLNDSSSSVFGGPTTPELAHEGGEASQQGWQRHIPAAAYLED
jgi:hypothetical protein